MGWRNVAYSALDDAEKALKAARRALDARKPEDFVSACLQASEALIHAIGLAVDDGLPTLVRRDGPGPDEGPSGPIHT
jgi:hypothetical protein